MAPLAEHEAALECLRRGDLGAAEVLYRRALEAEPGHPATLLGLAVIAGRLGRPDEALGWLEQAARGDPGAPAGPSALAEVLARLARAGDGPRPGLVPVEVAPGELLDKITILEIKSERMTDPDQLAQVRDELECLRSARERYVPHWRTQAPAVEALRERNAALWDVENALRACERDAEFGPGFVELARAVYRHNDERSRLKRRLNEAFGAAYSEQKDYLGPGSPVGPAPGQAGGPPSS